jgi:acyl carrier protein
MVMNEKEIMDKIITIFRSLLEVEHITKENSLIDDLEISSLESFVVLGELEEAFGISIPEKMVLQMVTIEDVFQIVTDILNSKKLSVGS